MSKTKTPFLRIVLVESALFFLCGILGSILSIVLALMGLSLPGRELSGVAVQVMIGAAVGGYLGMRWAAKLYDLEFQKLPLAIGILAGAILTWNMLVKTYALFLPAFVLVVFSAAIIFFCALIGQHWNSVLNVLSYRKIKQKN